MEYLEIGQIVNTQGLKGEVRINPFTDDITRFDKLKKIYVDKDKKKLEIEKVRYVKNLVIAKFKGLNKIEDVECFKGKYIFIDEIDKLQLPEDTYYITDLIGSKVIDNATNNEIGTITDVFSTGSNDVYVVKTLDKEILLPAIKQVILNIDINEKIINVNLIEGLI